MCDCTCPKFIHIGPKAEAKIALGIKRAAAHLKPDIVWIRYRIGEDWTGDTSIFYYLILKEYVPEVSFKVIRKAVELLDDFIDIAEIGIHSYNNCRTVEEMEDIEKRLLKHPNGEFSSDIKQWRKL